MGKHTELYKYKAVTSGFHVEEMLSKVNTHRSPSRSCFDQSYVFPCLLWAKHPAFGHFWWKETALTALTLAAHNWWKFFLLFLYFCQIDCFLTTTYHMICREWSQRAFNPRKISHRSHGSTDFFFFILKCTHTIRKCKKMAGQNTFEILI